MEECSLDLIFFKLETDQLFFWLGAGADFFQQHKLDFFRQSKSTFFCNHKSSFLQLLLALNACLTSVSSNKYISDQHF